MEFLKIVIESSNNQALSQFTHHTKQLVTFTCTIILLHRSSVPACFIGIVFLFYKSQISITSFALNLIFSEDDDISKSVVSQDDKRICAFTFL
ncbi:hypothetical protein TNCT_177261 [Trichonephila clavata]|uniref:Uncharacterized protein n=1 Tax=Trichonephila clavata TaxID=2740835 RepID=A0A8X6LMB2_TRICU|nr:hypothetical protein TNCT_177261 [Trichonephila clavata]